MSIGLARCTLNHVILEYAQLPKAERSTVTPYLLHIRVAKGLNNRCRWDSGDETVCISFNHHLTRDFDFLVPSEWARVHEPSVPLEPSFFRDRIEPWWIPPKARMAQVREWLFLPAHSYLIAPLETIISTIFHPSIELNELFYTMLPYELSVLFRLVPSKRLSLCQ